MSEAFEEIAADNAPKCTYMSWKRMYEETKAELDRLRAENRSLNEMLDAEKVAVGKAVKAVMEDNRRLREILKSARHHIPGEHDFDHTPSDDAMRDEIDAILTSTAQEDPCQPQD